MPRSWCGGDAGQSGQVLTLAANLKAAEAQGFPPVSGQVLWTARSTRNDRFGPWSVRWSIELVSPGHAPPPSTNSPLYGRRALVP